MIKINEMEAMEEFKDCGRGIIAPHCDTGSSLSRLNSDVKTRDTTLLIGSKRKTYILHTGEAFRHVRGRGQLPGRRSRPEREREREQRLNRHSIKENPLHHHKI